MVPNDGKNFTTRLKASFARCKRYLQRRFQLRNVYVKNCYHYLFVYTIIVPSTNYDAIKYQSQLTSMMVKSAYEPVAHQAGGYIRFL